MLQPPQPVDGLVPVKQPQQVTVALDDILPGAASSSQPPHLHCVGADDKDDCRCLAPLARGGRCKRKRQEGNYCRQHFLEWSAKDKSDKVFSDWQDLVEGAAETWAPAGFFCFR